MNDIEMCNIPEETSPKDDLRNFEYSRKPSIKKKVRFADELVQNDDAHSSKSNLCQCNLTIKQDIPVRFQTIVYQLHFLFLFHNVINVCNILFSVFAVQTTAGITSAVVYEVISFMYSYVVWYQCAYKTFTRKSKCCFITFLVTFTLQIFISCIQTVGIHSPISTGFLSAWEKTPNPQSYSNYKMIPEVIIASVCACGALFDVIVIVMILSMYSKIMNFCTTNSP